MTDHERTSILDAYSMGNVGTRAAIEKLGLDDYANLLIALASRNLPFPRPAHSEALFAHEARAHAILLPRLTRGR